MRRIIHILLIAIGLFLSLRGRAQGTLYISNLGQTPGGSLAVTSDAWVAQPFVTGNNSGDYVLNSIQLIMDAASGSPSGFNVALYSAILGPHALQPYEDLGALSGPDPSAGGVFTYSASDLTLLPSTEYFIVLTAASPAADGSYSSSTTFTLGNASGGWEFDTLSYSSNDGSTWSFTRGNFSQFDINATAVPEPSAWILCLLGGGVAFYVHTRKRPTLRAKLN